MWCRDVVPRRILSRSGKEKIGYYSSSTLLGCYNINIKGGGGGKGRIGKMGKKNPEE